MKISDSDKQQLIDYANNAKGSGIDKIYLHWSASRYDQVFNDYHINILGDGTVYFTTDNLAEVKSHTWHRNTGAIGITLACAYNASSPENMGDYPPTPQQIETMAQVVAILCGILDIPITKENVMTHAEAADLDGYGPETTVERWDLWKLVDSDGVMKSGGDVIRGKAIYYQQKGF
jgi:hypothetical protein